MKVSVITVCHNSIATIGDALDSVATQSWRDTEHILIDGASDDGTLAYVQSRGRGLAHVVSEPDNGIYDAMNKGLGLATGDIVCFLNADDHYSGPDVLREVVAIMGRSGADAVLADVEFYRPTDPSRIIRRYRSSRFRPERIPWGWMPAHPGMFVRRSVYNDVGPFSVDFRIAGDFEWVLRAFLRRATSYVHWPSVAVRMRVGGVSTAGLRSTIRLNTEILQACKRHSIRTNWFKLAARYPLKVLEFMAPNV